MSDRLFPSPPTTALAALLLFIVAPATMAAGEPLQLTLNEVVRRALASSYSLVEAQKRIAAAQSYLDRSSAWLASNPHVTAGGAASDSKFATERQGGTEGPTQTFGPSYTITLQQDFEVAGQRGLRMTAAEHSLEVTRYDRSSREATVRADAKKAFTDALESTAKMELAAHSTELIKEINAGFDVDGIDTTAERITYNSSTIQLLRQRRREAAARRDRARAYDDLKRLTGIPVAQQISVVGDLQSVARPLPPLDALREGLAERRPDVQAYRSLLARADAELTLAKRLAIPDVSVWAYVSRFDGGDSGRETSGGGSLGVTLPLFQGNGPSISDAIGERQRAAAELDDLIRAVESNLVASYRNCEDAAGELALTGEEILPRARENLELQKRRESRGEVSVYDVIEYELEVVSAEQDLLSARRIYADSLIDLEKAAAVTLVGEPDSSDVPSAAPGDQDPHTEQ